MTRRVETETRQAEMVMRRGENQKRRDGNRCMWWWKTKPPGWKKWYAVVKEEDAAVDMLMCCRENNFALVEGVARPWEVAMHRWEGVVRGGKCGWTVAYGRQEVCSINCVGWGHRYKPRVEKLPKKCLY